MKKVLFLLILTSILFSQFTRQTDSLALVKLYQSTNGFLWTNNLNWLSEKPISDWHGVTLVNNRVLYLNLIANGLSGELPADIGNLTELTYLNLNSNNLFGSLPSSIGQLKKLNFLSISRNLISGELPVEIATIDSLRALYIYDNLFSKLGDLSSLKTNVFNAYDNVLSFDDIISNINVLSRYSPQKQYSLDLDTSYTEGKFFAFTITNPDISTTNSTYEWYKDGFLIENQNSNTLKISSLKISDNGNYVCKISNSSAPNLILNSGLISLTVNKENAPATPANIYLESSDNEIFVNWDFPESSDFKNFYFYLDTVPAPKIRVDSLFIPDVRSFTISNLKPAKTYYLRMTARNLDLNESYFSSDAIVTTKLNDYTTGYSFNTKLIDHEDLGNVSYNDIWGFKRNDQEYIIISKTFGFAVYEVKDDGDAVLKIEEKSVNNEESGWGEVRFYNDYVYKSTESGPIRIYKLDFLNDSSIFIKAFGEKAHNISLYKNSLLACGGFYSGVKSWNIDDPENPVSNWHYKQFYVHDFVVQDDKLYLAELYESNFAVYDISAVTDTILTEDYLLMRHHYENGFTHNIWPNSNGKYVVTSDEHDQFDHMQVWDIQDKNNIKNLLRHQEGVSGVIHNAFIKGDYIYASYYTRGFVMFDMSDPELVVKIAQYDAFPDNDNSAFEGTWGVYPFMNNGYVALSNRVTGLDIVKVDTSLFAGIYNLVIMESEGVPFAGDYQVSTADHKTFKYKIDSNKITMKAVPDYSKNFSLTIPSLNYSRGFDYFFEVNTSKTDTIFLDKEISFISNLSFFQNPVLNQFITITYTTEDILTETPFLTVEKAGELDTLLMDLNASSSNNYSTQYRLSTNGDYKFIVSAVIGTKTKMENRTLSVVLFKEKIINDASILGGNLKLSFNTEEPTYIMSELRENNEYIVSPGLRLSSEAKLSFKIPDQFSKSKHLFLFKKINNKWSPLDTYMNGDEITVYTKEFGEFKIDFDFQNENYTVPTEFNIEQNYPNPFNPTTTIKYDVANDGNLQIFIYNVLGQRVKKLVNSYHKAKSGYKVVWDARNDNDQLLSSGVYFYQIITDRFVKSRKMILLK
jgi:choice-of-anchor B domain-containing protein